METRSSVASNRPAWQLPAGVSRGAWDYATEPSIATQYDSFHQDHPLLDLDRDLIDRWIGEDIHREDGSPKVAIDLGCGTGRNLLPLAERGWRTIGVDLSHDMLRRLRDKADANRELGDRVASVYANMVQLECFADRVADLACACTVRSE